MFINAKIQNKRTPTKEKASKHEKTAFLTLQEGCLHGITSFLRHEALVCLVVKEHPYLGDLPFWTFHVFHFRLHWSGITGIDRMRSSRLAAA